MELLGIKARLHMIDNDFEGARKTFIQTKQIINKIGKTAAFKELCENFIEKTRTEENCHYYGFSFNGDQVHCREGYKDADGLLSHLDNVGTLLGEALKITDITKLEVHGPKEELAKLKKPLADLNPQFFTLEYGFRN